jgi:hypothetical protein
MEIKVLKTTKAASCPRGIGSKEYKEGEVYEIFDELAEVFVSQGWGVKAKEEKKEAPKKVELEDKAIKESPEDKAVKASKETKAKEESKPRAKAKKAKK